MSFDANHGGHLRDLQEQIHRARTITPGLMADVIARACPGVRAQPRSVKTRILHLIESGAFADATLALLELELPQWKLRRLIYEDGEWHCSLSKHVSLPTELDEMAEANHEDLPLAIRRSAASESHHGSKPGTLCAANSCRTELRRVLRQFCLS
jgi:hypothetical protein